MMLKFFQNLEMILYYDTNTGRWYVKNVARNIDYDLLFENLSPFLQVFKEDPVIFLSNGLAKLKEGGLEENIIDSLPFNRTIEFCIKNKLVFWLELSLKWIKFIRTDDELIKVIKEASTNPVFPKNLRHKMRQALSTRSLLQGTPRWEKKVE